MTLAAKLSFGGIQQYDSSLPVCIQHNLLGCTLKKFQPQMAQMQINKLFSVSLKP